VGPGERRRAAQPLSRGIFRATEETRNRIRAMAEPRFSSVTPYHSARAAKACRLPPTKEFHPMRKSFLTLAVAGALLATPAFAADYITNAAEIVKAADWEKMETVVIELDDYSFAPQDLKLKAGTPYRLVIKNVGENDHYYTADKFFKSVAWRKVQTPKPNGGEVKAPYFTALEAYKNGGVVEAFFVTVDKGTFDVLCTIDDHKDKGMHGTISVE
jgi:uncharacterized cupredoxin-like copper-binding protein